MQILEFYHKDQKIPESTQRFEINSTSPDPDASPSPDTSCRAKSRSMTGEKKAAEALRLVA